MDPNMVDGIKNADEPKRKAELRSFLGLQRYYGRFIRGFEEKLSVPHDATSRNNPSAGILRVQHLGIC